MDDKMPFAGRRDKSDTPLPSLRNFGLTFTCVFAIIGLMHVPFGGDVRLWALAVAACFLIVTFTRPQLLTPLNRLWFRFGMLLHKVMNPLIMGIIYYGLLVPMALVMRASGKRFLALARQQDAKTYWIDRDPPGPSPSSIQQQY